MNGTCYFPPSEGWHPAGVEPGNSHRIRVVDSEGNTTWSDCDLKRSHCDDGRIALPHATPWASVEEDATDDSWEGSCLIVGRRP